MDAPKLFYAAINDDYSYGCFLKTQIVIKHDDGFINATKLCSNAGKTFSHWKRTKQAQDLIANYIQQFPNTTAHDLFKEKKNGKGDGLITSGMYVHPDIIIHIAIWAAPRIANELSHIVQHKVNRQWKAMAPAKKDEAYQEALGMIVEPDDDKLDKSKEDKAADKAAAAERRANEAKVKVQKAASVVEEYAEKIGYVRQ